MAGTAGRHRPRLRGRGAPVLTRFVLLNPNTSTATTAAMVAVAREALPPASMVEGLTAPFGAPLIVDAGGLAAASRAVLSLAPRLRAARLDGVIVSAFGDPGLRALRDRLDCPVTGIAEAGMAEAAAGGRRFAVVTTTADLVASIAAMASAYGHAPLFRGTALTPGDARALMAEPQRLVEALAAACRTAVRDLGAEAIVIGGGPLATAARALVGLTPVSLIEPVPAAARLAMRRSHRRHSTRLPLS